MSTATTARIALRAAVALLTIGALAGCLIGGGGSPRESGPNSARQVDRSAMAVDEKSAVDVVNGFWSRHFKEQFGRNYQGPRVAGGYVGSGGPNCDSQQSVPFNAYYCPAGDYLAWDENLMAAGYQQIGDAWVYLIIAHEWGHAIQARLDQSLVSVAAELQADCLAGAALQGAAKDGQLQFEPGDAEELAKTLTAVSDDYPWTQQSDHGDAQQRIDAFNTGTSRGVAGCISGR